MQGITTVVLVYSREKLLKEGTGGQAGRRLRTLHRLGTEYDTHAPTPQGHSATLKLPLMLLHGWNYCLHSSRQTSISMQTQPFISHFNSYSWQITELPNSNADINATIKSCLLKTHSGYPQIVLKRNRGAHGSLNINLAELWGWVCNQFLIKTGH